jgi:hypothetical protein
MLWVSFKFFSLMIMLKLFSTINRLSTFRNLLLICASKGCLWSKPLPSIVQYTHFYLLTLAALDSFDLVIIYVKKTKKQKNTRCIRPLILLLWDEQANQLQHVPPFLWYLGNSYNHQPLFACFFLNIPLLMNCGRAIIQFVKSVSITCVASILIAFLLTPRCAAIYRCLTHA